MLVGMVDQGYMASKAFTAFKVKEVIKEVKKAYRQGYNSVALTVMLDGYHERLIGIVVSKRKSGRVVKDPEAWLLKAFGLMETKADKLRAIADEERAV